MLLTWAAFADVAQRFGIKDVVEGGLVALKIIWVFKRFTGYFQAVRYAALIDIAAFTLMRIEEAASVRWNCLVWHEDPVFGSIPLIQAETTKTDPDDSGCWITSPSIEPAIGALKSIAKMRLTCVGRWSNEDNPGLMRLSRGEGAGY